MLDAAVAEPALRRRRRPPPEDVVRWVGRHLGDLTLESAGAIAAGGFRGGQQAADQALAALDVTGYAKDRSVVLPVERRGASRLSPYIRHGLLPLTDVWSAVADAPPRDRTRYRDELLWQEFARHLYARVGTASGEPLTRAQPGAARWNREPWPAEMNCMSSVVDELHTDGWLVNQTRMWLASQWAVRAGKDWRRGEQEMFVHLLDGSRAANRLGWQWTVGTGSGKPYGFSRWQVEKRAPALCRDCALSAACPIQQWPDADPGPSIAGPDLGKGPIPAGPDRVTGSGTGEQVWLTAESMGVSDPALAAASDRPAVFVFDEPLLSKLRLSGKRLVFLAETLGELSELRPLEVRRGVVADELAGRTLAATLDTGARLESDLPPAAARRGASLAVAGAAGGDVGPLVQCVAARQQALTGGTGAARPNRDPVAGDSWSLPAGPAGRQRPL